MKYFVLIFLIVINFSAFARDVSKAIWKYEKSQDSVTREIRENIVGTNDNGIMYAMCITENEKSNNTNLFIGFRGYEFEITKNELDNRLALKIDENEPYIMSGSEFLGGTIVVDNDKTFSVLLELINGKVIVIRLTDDKNIYQNIRVELDGFMPSFVKTSCWKKLRSQSK